MALLCAYANYGLMAAPHLDDSVCKETIQHLLSTVSRFCVSKQLIALKASYRIKQMNLFLPSQVASSKT